MVRNYQRSLLICLCCQINFKLYHNYNLAKEYLSSIRNILEASSIRQLGRAFSILLQGHILRFIRCEFNNTLFSFLSNVAVDLVFFPNPKFEVFTLCFLGKVGAVIHLQLGYDCHQTFPNVGS